MPIRRSPASWAPTCSGGSSPSSSGCRTTRASRSRTPPLRSSSSSGSRAGPSIWFRRSARSRSRLAVYRTGGVLFGRGAGLLGVLFTTVVSAYVAANYTLARAYYIEHLLVGQVVLLGAALWLARPLSEPARCRVAIAMGLAGGLGLYFNFQIVDALIPALLALLLVEPRLAVPASGVARRRRVRPREPAVLGLQPHPRLGDGGDRRALPGASLGTRGRADPGRRSLAGRPRGPIRHGSARPSAGPARVDDPGGRGRRRPAPPGPGRGGPGTPPAGCRDAPARPSS